jgi:voltage-gated potassium channel
MSRPGPRVERFMQRLTIPRAILAIAAVAVVLTVCGGLLIRIVEPETFPTIGDGLWWALQTVSTVGYGDVVPESRGGRAIGALLMLLGIALVPAFTSIVVAVLINRLQERARGDSSEAQRSR